MFWFSIPVGPATCIVPSHLLAGETVMLVHLPLHLAGVSIAMERERQQNDSLADGHSHRRSEALRWSKR